MKKNVIKEKPLKSLKGRKLAKHLDAKMPWYLKREPDRKRDRESDSSIGKKDNFCDSCVDYII